MDEPTTTTAPSSERVYAPDPRAEVIAALDSIAGYQHNISAALLHMSGIAVGYVEDDQIKLRAPTEADNVQQVRRIPGNVSTRWGDKEAVAWVFMPTAPCNDMEVVCVPDVSTELGMRCVVNRKIIGGEVARYDVSFTRQEKI